tara:strand:- start:477 stop:1298 length:822 start_codon:yes stop_codon:yes gene_type:complete
MCSKKKLGILTEKARDFPMIDLNSNMEKYVKIVDSLYFRGLNFLTDSNRDFAFILLLRCSIICLEILPNHVSYRFYKKEIKNLALKCLSDLEQLKLYFYNIKANKKLLNKKKANEPKTLDDLLLLYGLKQIIMPSDGNCQFHSISHQLSECPLNLKISYIKLREMAVNFLKDNSEINMDDGSLGGNFCLREACGFYDKALWKKYLKGMSKFDWGDSCTLLAISAIFKIKIRILSSEGNTHLITPPEFWNLECSHIIINIIHVYERHYNSTKKI